MIQKISFHNATRILLLMLALITVYHLIILGGLIPFEQVWGGHLKTIQQMFVFEGFSIVINLLVILIVLIKAAYLRLRVSSALIQFLLWCLVILFALNTLGNLVAKTNLEKLFALLSFVMAVLCFRLVKENNGKK
ncbi:MAG: hypothetical protein HYZ42_17585 [Bacteroidetes bacterium]|nr:hypothetical protein [Bacteroidota bacterium]